MTYPPQPGPYGSPQPRPYGQQPPPPDLFTPQQPSYQGLGTYSTDPGEPPPPRRRSTAKIVAVVVIALLVLGGGGAGAYFLIKNKGDDNTGAQENKPNQPRPNDSNGSGPIDDDTPPEQQNGGSTDPAGVQQAYIEAYETKQFGDVVNSACEAYKKKFGTNTRDLETKLADYDIKATADGKPAVTGGSATATIALELTKDGETKTPKIKIKIVKESGKWKFCGEGEA